jgi:trehalose-6-phosphate synthase
MEEVAKRIRELNEKYKEETLIVGVDQLYRNRLLQRLQGYDGPYANIRN